MAWRLQLLFVPVSDVDRAKTFYRDKVGFDEDFDTRFTRSVQLTPPGSGCPIALLTGMTPGLGLEDMEPGSLSGLQVDVSDIKAARARLIGNGWVLQQGPGDE